MFALASPQLKGSYWKFSLINSHIIPAFYLERFATPSTRGPNNPGRVCVYEKGEEPDDRATSVQGRENGYFAFVQPDGTVEESFEAVLAAREGECNEILELARSPLYRWPPVPKKNWRSTPHFSSGVQLSRDHIPTVIGKKSSRRCAKQRTIPNIFSRPHWTSHASVVSPLLTPCCVTP